VRGARHSDGRSWRGRLRSPRTLGLLALVAAAACERGPSPAPAGLGPFDLPRLRTFSAHRASSDHPFVDSNDDEKRIMPGQTYVMADLDGPGVVTHLWITVADNEYAWPRLLRLRVYYDGEKTPSVDAPLGDFFGVGHGYEKDVNSLMVRDNSYGRARNSYWPMPFRKHCRVTVTNEGRRPVTMFYDHVDWEKREALPPGTGYFHAYYRQERPATPGLDYAFLAIHGRGQYVGTVLNVIQSQVGWFGEGDDLFYVDGATKPQIAGTGSEDYFNAAWGLRVTEGPWSGIPVAEGERVGARLTGYRWHVPDMIPFQKSIWAGIEHFGWTYNPDGSLRSGFEERPDYFSSVAFWYQDGVNQGLPEPPYGDARLPFGNARQIAVEDAIGQVRTRGGTAEVQREVDWGKDLLFFDGRGPGSRIDVPIDVADPDRYEVVAEMARAPDYGDYYALLDGKAMNLDTREAATSELPAQGARVFPGYDPELYVAEVRPLGWATLSRGRHILTFVCAGKDGRSTGYKAGIMDVVLEKIPASAGEPEKPTPRQLPPPLPEAPASAPTGEAVYRGHPLSDWLARLKQAPDSERPDAVRALGAFGADAGPAVDALTGALHDPAPAVRSAAAWALSQVGPTGAAAVPELAKALSDSVARVRSLAAVALEGMGPKAAPALDPLIRAVDDPVAWVRSPAAEALGAVGPGAGGAVEALTKRMDVKGEPVYVLRSVIKAIGEIGPAAKSALPALRRALGNPRTIYTAQEAILKVEGKPDRTW